MRLINNEVFESKLTNTFLSDSKVNYKIQKYSDCDESCSNEKLINFKTELKNKQSMIRDPYYGDIPKGLIDCISPALIDADFEVTKTDSRYRIKVFANKNFALFLCKDPNTSYIMNIDILYCRKSKIFYIIKALTKKTTASFETLYCE